MQSKFQKNLIQLALMLVLLPCVYSEMRHQSEECDDINNTLMVEDEVIFTLDNFSLDDIGIIQQLFNEFDETEMFTENRTSIIFVVTLLALTPLVCCEVEMPEEGRGEKEIDNAVDNPLSDDEISYALSDFSVRDLNALSQLIDVLNEPDDQFLDSGEGDKYQQASEELARFKRENSGIPAVENQGNSPNIDEDYIRQLAESFPNVVDQSNQDDKEKEHIRVKRD